MPIPCSDPGQSCDKIPQKARTLLSSTKSRRHNQVCPSRRRGLVTAPGRGHWPPHPPCCPHSDSPKHGCCLPGVLLGWGGGARGQEGIGACLLPVKGLILGNASLLHAVLKHRHDQLQGMGVAGQRGDPRASRVGGETAGMQWGNMGTSGSGVGLEGALEGEVHIDFK